jgi:mycobactin phenyloxazoline synthetase
MDGELALRGRAGRIVKIGGRRIELGEIEAAFRRVPGVTEAFTAAHPSLADELAAVVQTTLSERELRAVLATQWPPWKIPRRLVCRPSLPTTSRGKMDTPALRRLLAERAGASPSPAASENRATPLDQTSAGSGG